GSPVAAFALPELTTAARTDPRSHCSLQTLTGAAAAALRVRSSAERTSSESHATRPTSVSPPPLRPQATPAALNPGASCAGPSSSTPSGELTHLDRKNGAAGA